MQLPSGNTTHTAHVSRSGTNCKPALATALIPDRGRNHFEHSPQAIVSTHAPFVEWSPRDRLPVVTGTVVRKSLRQTGECRVILPVLAAQFINHQVERRHDENAEATRAGFIER